MHTPKEKNVCPLFLSFMIFGIHTLNASSNSCSVLPCQQCYMSFSVALLGLHSVLLLSELRTMDVLASLENHVFFSLTHNCCTGMERNKYIRCLHIWKIPCFMLHDMERNHAWVGKQVHGFGAQVLEKNV
jgi:hypothetical protein